MNFKQANSSNFKVGRTKPIEYIVIHYTANNGDTAKNNVDYFSRTPNLSASAHYFVDENEVWQSVQDKDTAWHCGGSTYKHKSCRNANSIGIELCSRKDTSGKYYFKDATVKRAAALTKNLMDKYNIPATNIIRHYDVTGKICPAPMVNDEKQWKDFLAMLSKSSKAESGKEIVEKLISDYKIKIEDVNRAVKAVDMAKTDPNYLSLYWILYKAANGNG